MSARRRVEAIVLKSNGGILTGHSRVFHGTMMHHTDLEHRLHRLRHLPPTHRRQIELDGLWTPTPFRQLPALVRMPLFLAVGISWSEMVVSPLGI